MASFRENSLALRNRKLLRQISARAATIQISQRHLKAASKLAEKIQEIAFTYGPQAAKAFEDQDHRNISILAGNSTPTQDEALDLLQQMIPHLPSEIHGFTQGEILLISPILVLLSQVDGKADFHIITDQQIFDFIDKLGGNGWDVNQFPPNATILPKTPKHLKARIGVKNHDLPQSASTKRLWGAEEKKTLSLGQEWIQPVFHQDDKSRQQGAEIFAHMMVGKYFPSFDFKDANQCRVSERDIQPDSSDDHECCVNLILEHDELEQERTLLSNMNILIRQARCVLWAQQNPDAPVLPLLANFNSLGMIQPDYQCRLFLRIADELGHPSAVGRGDQDIFSSSVGFALSVKMRVVGRDQEQDEGISYGDLEFLERFIDQF